MTPVASIIIPTYQHGPVVADAIESALAQTVPCEVIVIDDGSTDETAAVLARYADRIRVITLPHGGPSLARNAGLAVATGACVMFLDADDLIAPQKVEIQYRALTPDIGWVLCDVRIQDVSGRVQLASQRYEYARKPMTGWMQPWLGVANFVPIHAPLVRRSLLEGLTFPADKTPEDWHFWYAVAGVGRCAYVPHVLATYRKRRGGRNTGRWRGLMTWPGAEMPLRLNLGCGTPGKPSWHPLPGFVNLDKSLGWRFQDGLRAFTDASVDGITISHALMFLPQPEWPTLFAELARVLRPGGVLRVTEDDATSRASARYGGWKGSESAITLTDAALVRRHMEAVGLTVQVVSPVTSSYLDASLCQAFHGEAPDVFVIEGCRSGDVLFAPHADDESLFAAFTLIRYRPRVVICCPSVRDYGETAVRTAESAEAMTLLGAGPVDQWDGVDLAAQMRAFDARLRPARVWAPSRQTAHPDHLAVAVAADAVFGARVTHYHTYSAAGKVRDGALVPFEPGWQAMKRQALTCYRTQRDHPRAATFFQWDDAEYTEDAIV